MHETSTTSDTTTTTTRRSPTILYVLGILSLGCVIVTFTLGHNALHLEEDARRAWNLVQGGERNGGGPSPWMLQRVRSTRGSQPAVATRPPPPPPSSSGSTPQDIEAEDRVIIHFSTDCTDFQNWQAFTLLESAERVGQRGAIVRVVSGCDGESTSEDVQQLTREEIEAQHKAFDAAAALMGKEPTFRFHLYFVGDMMKIDANKKGDKGAKVTYKFANKAQSLHYWLDELGGGTLRDVMKLKGEGSAAAAAAAAGEMGDDEDEDVVIVSLDPDFLFMKRFGPKELGLYEMDRDVRGEQNSHVTSVTPPATGREIISRMRGRPVAQQYGLGHAWLRLPVCKQDVDGCAQVNDWNATRLYDAGPPYALHRKDWGLFLDTWTELIPQVYKEYTTLDELKQDPTCHYAEMFAWSMAAAKLHLPHRLLQSEMVGCMTGYRKELMQQAVNESKHSLHAHSDTQRDDAVGAADFVCGFDTVIGHSEKLPAFLHYCQRHVINAEGRKWIFFKRMLPRDLIFDCGGHLIELPPAAALGDGGDEASFITCMLTEIINACKRRYRQSPACVGHEREKEKERYDVVIVPEQGWRKIGKGQVGEQRRSKEEQAIKR